MTIKNLNKMTLKELEHEISWRKEVLPTLVGGLYPALVIEEINELFERKCEIEDILRRENRSA